VLIGRFDFTSRFHGSLANLLQSTVLATRWVNGITFGLIYTVKLVVYNLIIHFAGRLTLKRRVWSCFVVMLDLALLNLFFMQANHV